MRRFAIKSCTWSVSCPVLLSKMGAMRHQKLVGIEVEPLYCKVYDPLPHGTSRLSRFRFGQSVPTPFLWAHLDTIGTYERASAPQRAEQPCGRRVGCRTFARVAMMLALGPRWSRLPQRRLLNVQRAPASSPTPVRSAGQHPGPARRAPWCARRLCGVLRLARQPASHKPLHQAPSGGDARN